MRKEILIYFVLSAFCSIFARIMISKNKIKYIRSLELKKNRNKEGKFVAEGHKESQILDAEAQKQAAILRAEAVKEAKIREAEGEAEAILAVQRANAKAIELINQANPNQAVLTLKSLEAFAKAADGQATKIIIPSEIQGIAGLATSLKELVTDENKE